MVTDTTTKVLFTADDLLTLPTGRGQRYELLKGELHTMTPAGGQHGRLHLKLGAKLLNYVTQHQLGEVFGAETGFRIERQPDTVRAPDVAFLAAERWAEQEHPEGFIEGPPDLAVEIVSPGDRREQVQEKAQSWLSAGARLVWVVQPRSRTVEVYRLDQERQVLQVTDTLLGEDVVPGFAVVVQSLFE